MQGDHPAVLTSIRLADQIRRGIEGTRAAPKMIGLLKRWSKDVQYVGLGIGLWAVEGSVRMGLRFVMRLHSRHEMFPLSDQVVGLVTLLHALRAALSFPR